MDIYNPIPLDEQTIKTQQKDSVNQFLNETQNESLFQEDLLYRNRTDLTYSNDKRFIPGSEKQDSAKLGKKVFKASTPAEKQRNKMIDEAKKLTSEATAYTLETYDTVKQVIYKEDEAHQKTEKRYDKDMMRYRIKTFHFTPVMMSGANIRKNLAEYTALIRGYDKLVEDGDPKIEVMELFKKRVRAYLEANRVKLDGSILTKYEPPVSMSDQELSRYLMITNQVKAPDYIPQPGTEEEIQKRIKKLEEDFEQASLTLEDRLEYYKLLRKDKKIDETPDANEIEIISQLKRSVMVLRGQLLLEKQKAKILELKKNYANALEAQLQAKETYDDLQRILDREMRLTIGGLTVRETGHPAVYKVTKDDAKNTLSDSKNMVFKNKTLELAETLGTAANGLPETDRQIALSAVQAVNLYAASSHYTDGYEKEKKLLKAALSSLNEVATHYTDQNILAAQKDILDHLRSLTMGSTNIPTWDEIPEEMRDDHFINNTTVVETTTRFKGGTRNSIMNNDTMRSWVNVSDDPLFCHEPTVNDLRQGKVSNCYMIASTTGLVGLDASILKNAIRDNGDGSVTVRLFKEGSSANPIPVYIRVKKEIPKLFTGGDILSSGALWMQLIEKAAAFMGKEGEKGYNTLWYGEGGNWLFKLTGQKRKVIIAEGSLTTEYTRDDNPKDLFEEIMNARKNNEVFNCATGEDASDSLNAGHAYTVLGGKVENGIKYVILRNPYANMSLRYDEDGTSYMKHGRKLSFLSSTVGETCGQFAITYDDFIANMKSVTKTKMDNVFSEEKLSDMFMDDEDKTASHLLQRYKQKVDDEIRAETMATNDQAANWEAF